MRWKFSCHKKGHEPHPKHMVQTHVFGTEDDVRNGTAIAMDSNVCVNCGCLYFEANPFKKPTLIIQP